MVEWGGYVVTVGIYVLLGALSLWGYAAWDSIFMLIFGCVCLYTGLLIAGWYLFGYHHEDDESSDRHSRS